MSVNDQISGTAESPSPGQMLALARERANLTHEYVASALHMTVTKVKAIEQDDYKKLNVETYIRGYLRSYAALVKIDSAPVLAAYEALVASGGCTVPKADYIVRPPVARKGLGFILFVVALLALLLLISVWFLGNRIQPEPVLPTLPLPATALVNSSSSTASQVTALPLDEVEAGSGEVGDTEPAGRNNTSSVAVPEAEITAGTEVQSASQSQLDHLYFVFDEECWIEVSDSQGDVLATALQPPGSRLALIGKAPFKVKLGKAHKTTVTLNNQPVEINAPEGVDLYNFTVGQ